MTKSYEVLHFRNFNGDKLHERRQKYTEYKNVQQDAKIQYYTG
jgi:hypothetical protein